MAARARRLEGVGELRILAPDTDLTLSFAGRTWLAADGRQNLPDGDVYASPVETSASRTVRFTFPALVAAEARTGGDFLRSLPAADDGAAVLGEVAFGLNPEPGSTVSPATSASTRRSAAPCTWRWARATRRRAGSTGRGCTGTWSATSTAAARSGPTGALADRAGRFLPGMLK